MQHRCRGEEKGQRSSLGAHKIRRPQRKEEFGRATHVKSLVKNSDRNSLRTCSFKYLALKSTLLPSNPVCLHLTVSSSRMPSMYLAVIFLPSEVEEPWCTQDQS